MMSERDKPGYEKLTGAKKDHLSGIGIDQQDWKMLRQFAIIFSRWQFGVDVSDKETVSSIA